MDLPERRNLAWRAIAGGWKKKMDRRPAWRDGDRAHLARCGIHLEPSLRVGRQGTLQPTAVVAAGAPWTPTHTFYCVYGACMRARLPDRPAWQCGAMRSRPNAPIELSFEHVMRQNHTCIAQLIVRLGSAADGVVAFSEVASRVFARDAPGGAKTWELSAPARPGTYYFDWVTDWQYSMRDAVRNKVTAAKPAYPNERVLAVLRVGEELPWECERLVWLLCAGRRGGAVPPEIGRHICGFLAHWRPLEVDRTHEPPSVVDDGGL